MRNTILWSALFTVLCAQTQAETSQPNVQTPAAVSNSTPQTTTAQPVPSTATPPAVQQGQPVSQTVPVTMPAVAPVINCDYKISATTTTVDPSLVMTWSEKATTQAFEFDPNTLDAQMQKLQACFTDQGWVGFNTALQKSGNLEAIKAQHLTVSSQVDGKTQMNEVKENQWKISIPLQVVYQNDKEKVTQLLNIQVTVGRKITGDLGITQMIATPRSAEPVAMPAATVPSNNDAAPVKSPATETPAVSPAH